MILTTREGNGTNKICFSSANVYTLAHLGVVLIGMKNKEKEKNKKARKPACEERLQIANNLAIALMH